jgi:hypothetical protein
MCASGRYGPSWVLHHEIIDTLGRYCHDPRRGGDLVLRDAGGRSLTAQAGVKLALHKGDRIVLIGETFAERW